MNNQDVNMNDCDVNKTHTQDVNNTNIHDVNNTNTQNTPTSTQPPDVNNTNTPPNINACNEVILIIKGEYGGCNERECLYQGILKSVGKLFVKDMFMRQLEKGESGVEESTTIVYIILTKIIGGTQSENVRDMFKNIIGLKDIMPASELRDPFYVNKINETIIIAKNSSQQQHYQQQFFFRRN